MLLNSSYNLSHTETAAHCSAIMSECAKISVVIRSAVGKLVNVICFENSPDNLYPNPLIGSQCGPSEHTKRPTGRNSGHKGVLKGERLHLGTERAFHFLQQAFRRVLGCESSHVKSTTY